jgi:glycerol kinase
LISGALRRVGKESQFYPAILSARETADLALSVADTGGVRFLPAFTGLGAPWWEGEARGVFSGITGGTTKGHLVRAVLDSIAFRVRDVLEAAWGGGRARPETLCVDGGLTKNHYLMQRQADLLGLPVALGPSSEATATGAAALAAIGAG